MNSKVEDLVKWEALVCWLDVGLRGHPESVHILILQLVSPALSMPQFSDVYSSETIASSMAWWELNDQV